MFSTCRLPMQNLSAARRERDREVESLPGLPGDPVGSLVIRWVDSAEVGSQLVGAGG